MILFYYLLLLQTDELLLQFLRQDYLMFHVDGGAGHLWRLQPLGAATTNTSVHLTSMTLHCRNIITVENNKILSANKTFMCTKSYPPTDLVSYCTTSCPTVLIFLLSRSLSPLLSPSLPPSFSPHLVSLL